MGMGRGPRKHLKRLAAPKSWLIDLKKGVFAPRPSTGPHKLIESIPLNLIISDKLNLAMTSKEICHILSNKLILVNNRIRKDLKFPIGLFDVLHIPKTKESYRILYNTSGRFILHKINDQEKEYKLTTVTRKSLLKRNVPVLYTADGNTYTYCNQDIKVGDTVKVDLNTNRIIDHLSFAPGQIAMVKKGKNMGCVGTIISDDSDINGMDNKLHFIVKLRDGKGREFATERKNIVMIGEEGNKWISIPENEGVKMSVLDESNLKYLGEVTVEE